MKKSAAYVLIVLLMASTLPPQATADASQDIPSNAVATGVHDSLVAALTHADLVTTLQGAGPFTVFAPTDTAFAEAGIDLSTFDTPEENATLTAILLHHVVADSVPSSALSDGMFATTVNGDRVQFGVDANGVTVSNANVTTPDVAASNGIIHVIDKVMIPPVDIPATAQTTGIHNSLVAAVIQAELLPTLQGSGPFTVFAPTDQAFTDAGIDLADFDTRLKERPPSPTSCCTTWSVPTCLLRCDGLHDRGRRQRPTAFVHRERWCDGQRRQRVPHRRHLQQRSDSRH